MTDLNQGAGGAASPSNGHPDTIQDVLVKQRANRAANTMMEIAWQDFLELSEAERQEMLFIAIFETTAQVKWILGRLASLRP